MQDPEIQAICLHYRHLHIVMHHITKTENCCGRPIPTAGRRAAVLCRHLPLNNLQPTPLNSGIWIQVPTLVN